MTTRICHLFSVKKFNSLTYDQTLLFTHLLLKNTHTKCGLCLLMVNPIFQAARRIVGDTELVYHNINNVNFSVYVCNKNHTV